MSKGGGGDVAPVKGGGGQEHRPRGLIEILSEIEFYYAQERRGTPIDEEFLLTGWRIDLMGSGAKISFVSGMVTALISPLAIGVVEKNIPLFGSATATTFDRWFVVILALSYQITYAIIVAKAAYCGVGPYTKGMIRNFVGGIAMGAIAKMVIAVLLFHFIYLVVLTDQRIIKTLHYLDGLVTPEHLNATFFWLREFRPTLLTSSYFLIFTTFFYLSIPCISMIRSGRRNRQLRRVGIIR